MRPNLMDTVRLLLLLVIVCAVILDAATHLMSVEVIKWVTLIITLTLNLGAFIFCLRAIPLYFEHEPVVEYPPEPEQ